MHWLHRMGRRTPPGLRRSGLRTPPGLRRDSARTPLATCKRLGHTPCLARQSCGLPRFHGLRARTGLCAVRHSEATVAAAAAAVPWGGGLWACIAMVAMTLCDSRPLPARDDAVADLSGQQGCARPWLHPVSIRTSAPACAAPHVAHGDCALRPEQVVTAAHFFASSRSTKTRGGEVGLCLLAGTSLPPTSLGRGATLGWCLAESGFRPRTAGPPSICHP